jgi:hypothetical protein
MAIASAQFMVRYQTEIGRPEAAEEYQRKLDRLRDGLDRHYWQPEKGRHAWTLLPDGRPSGHDVVNFLLLPLWFGARLEKERETDDARAVLAYMDRETFRLPMVPGENHGFSGHTPAYLLHALTTLGHEDRHRVYRSIVDSLLVDEWGTVSEFYGPHDTSNGHSFNLYSTGITLDALWKYLAEGDPSHGDPT